MEHIHLLQVLIQGLIGTYPFVTSSHPGANGVSEGTGIGPLYIKESIGIIKAYTTRVGAGPFPTELDNEVGELIRQRGHEYGTVTQRARRTGWFDAVVVNQSRRMSSLTGISLMLLDVLSGFETIKICTAYKYRARRTGWFDAVVVNQSRRMSSLTGISLMLLDVLSGFETIKICTAYKYKGEIIHGLPATVKGIEEVEPVYEENYSWVTSNSKRN